MRMSDWSSDVCSSDLLGTGAAINLANGGTLSYTGVGASSNRTWSANGAVGISNDGTGALALGGDFAFDPLNPNPDMLTLGGEIGRASSRERVCQYVSISVDALSFKNKQTNSKAQVRKSLKK